jgi:glycosyltransferase involved in cell wall biosynthesis
MRVVVLGLRGIPDVQGGVETHCQNLFTRIAALGHEVTVVCRRPYVNGELCCGSVKLFSSRCPRQQNLEAVFHTFVGVFHAWRFRPDILHIHAIGPSLFVPLARLLGMRVVCTNHGPDYERVRWGRLARCVLRMGERLGSRFAHAVIAISPAIADRLVARHDRQVDIIPNGVVLQRRRTAENVLAGADLQSGKFILTVARLVPEKGLDDLMDAFQLASLPADWKLVIVGGADHSNQYSRLLVARGGRIAGVVMTGRLHGEPLAELYSHAGMFVLPSHHEGLPIVLLEALSYGLSVIASDIPAHRSLNLPESRLFRMGDPGSAAQKMTYFAAHPQTAEAEVEQINRVGEMFDWDLIAKKTLDVYGRVLRP